MIALLSTPPLSSPLLSFPLLSFPLLSSLLQLHKLLDFRELKEFATLLKRYRDDLPVGEFLSKLKDLYGQQRSFLIPGWWGGGRGEGGGEKGEGRKERRERKGEKGKERKERREEGRRMRGGGRGEKGEGKEKRGGFQSSCFLKRKE